ncbi:hypothetical protein [Dethiothermospora halolimnae]|uniref:hypothetical protein n=1 Tax=Dethiothermospora halolimnae TaxID=3114390 RepID=UPI003CCC2AFC
MINNDINENGLGNLELAHLSSEELKKIKAIENEINKNYHGDKVALMALNANKKLK